MKTLFPFVLCLAACPCAMAQSHLQIYGAVDQFVEHAKTRSGSITRLTDGGVVASRIGFRGTEDLGGGLSAGFNLEAGLAADTGAGAAPGPSLAFTRLSTLGLAGAWGRIDAGRMFTPLFNSVLRAEPFGANAIYSPINLASATDAQAGIVGYASRASNMLYWRSPASLPVMVHLAHAFGEAGSTGNGSGDLSGASLSYATGRFYVSYALQKTRGGSATAPLPKPRQSTFQGISASFNATPQLRVAGNLLRSDAGDPAIAGARVVNVGASWTTGASELRAGITHRGVDGSARGQVLWVLGYDHNLSRRTALYGRALHLRNRGGSTAAVAGLPIGATGGNGSSLGVGVRHAF